LPDVAYFTSYFTDYFDVESQAEQPQSGGFIAGPTRKGIKRAKDWLDRLKEKVVYAEGHAGLGFTAHADAEAKRAPRTPDDPVSRLRPILSLNPLKVSRKKPKIVFKPDTRRKEAAIRLAKHRVEEEIFLMVLLD
jgi:hypothetical protein